MKTIAFFISLFFFAHIAAQKENQFAESVEYLKNNPQKPDDYVISKFKSYPYVLVGEDHAIKENLEFIKNLIPKLYEAGVYNLCMEFGAFEKQKELDDLLNSETYDEKKAKDMMFFYNVGWAYKEYYDLYLAVWKFNKNLKKNDKKFRIVNMSYHYKWENFTGGARNPENMKKVFDLGTPDKFRAEILQKEIIARKEKALIYMGNVHVFTHYKMPILKINNDNFCDYDNGMLGNRLYQKYPNQIFTIMFHAPLFSKTQYNPALVSPANGEIENILDKTGNEAIGFDLKNSPLGKLRDDSFFSFCYQNFVMENLFDGYIFLKPFKNLTGCSYDESFFNSKNWNDVKSNFPDPDWRSPKNMDEYKKQIQEFVNVPKRYKEVITK